MRSKFLYILLFILFVGLALGFFFYNAVWRPNVNIQGESFELQIPTGTDYAGLKSILESKELILDQKSFDLVARLMKYDVGTVKSGLFSIQNDWSNRQLISHLRSGKQTPVNLTFNNFRTIQELAGGIAKQVELDSLTLLEYILDEQNLAIWNTDEQNILCQFIPNTYQVYWNMSAEKLVERLRKERDMFWSKNDRGIKAEQLGFKKDQLYTLASIVQKETLVNDEKSRIAGVYLNRIRKGMLLQADPTVVFAVGDFTIRRVLNKHLETKSPYNTYMNVGLPPGPIYMPDISTLEATLTPESHNYLYFCAKPDNSGRHAFAKTLAQHNANARKYQKWLSAQGIRR